MSKSYAVNYEGWLIVEADNENEAADAVNKMLGDSGIVNDGVTGEWYLGEIDEEEDDE